MRAYRTLIFVRVQLQLRSFESVAAWAGKVKANLHPPNGDLETNISRWSWLVDVAADHCIVPMRCLARSMARTRMLGRKGVLTELKFGVRNEGGKITGHAWVEWRSRSLNDRTNPGGPYEELIPVGDMKLIAEMR